MYKIVKWGRNLQWNMLYCICMHIYITPKEGEDLENYQKYALKPAAELQEMLKNAMLFVNKLKLGKIKA